MRKKHLATRLDELERRVRELEARPMPMQAPVIVAPSPLYPPPYPYTYPIITCQTGAVSSSVPGGAFVSGSTCSGSISTAPHGITLTGGH